MEYIKFKKEMKTFLEGKDLNKKEIIDIYNSSLDYLKQHENESKNPSDVASILNIIEHLFNLNYYFFFKEPENNDANDDILDYTKMLRDRFNENSIATGIEYLVKFNKINLLIEKDPKKAEEELKEKNFKLDELNGLDDSFIKEIEFCFNMLFLETKIALKEGQPALFIGMSSFKNMVGLVNHLDEQIKSRLILDIFADLGMTCFMFRIDPSMVVGFGQECIDLFYKHLKATATLADKQTMNNIYYTMIASCYYNNLYNLAISLYEQYKIFIKLNRIMSQPDVLKTRKLLSKMMDNDELNKKLVKNVNIDDLYQIYLIQYQTKLLIGNVLTDDKYAEHFKSVLKRKIDQLYIECDDFGINNACALAYESVAQYLVSTGDDNINEDAIKYFIEASKIYYHNGEKFNEKSNRMQAFVILNFTALYASRDGNKDISNNIFEGIIKSSYKEIEDNDTLIFYGQVVAAYASMILFTNPNRVIELVSLYTTKMETDYPKFKKVDEDSSAIARQDFVSLLFYKAYALKKLERSEEARDILEMIADFDQAAFNVENVEFDQSAYMNLLILFSKASVSYGEDAIKYYKQCKDLLDQTKALPITIYQSDLIDDIQHEIDLSLDALLNYGDEA